MRRPLIVTLRSIGWTCAVRGNAPFPRCPCVLAFLIFLRTLLHLLHRLTDLLLHLLHCFLPFLQLLLLDGGTSRRGGGRFDAATRERHDSEDYEERFHGLSPFKSN